MVNRENALKLAAQVEHSDTFDMSDWGSCLLAEFHKIERKPGPDDLVEWLGIPNEYERIGNTAYRVRYMLCAPEPGLLPNSIELYEITREHAARMLRHLAYTGKIDWKVTATG